VVTLVVWSFVMALTPVALGLALNLVAGILRAVLGLPRAFQDGNAWGPPHRLNFDAPSGCISWSGTTSWPETGRSRAPGRRVPC
jgi:hypothetical protein